MENKRMVFLKELWEDTDFDLIGIQSDYEQNIDRNQAIIDETGKSAYQKYRMDYYLNEFASAARKESYEFTANEIEEFAKTW